MIENLDIEDDAEFKKLKYLMAKAEIDSEINNQITDNKQKKIKI